MTLYADGIATIMQRGQMSATCAYDTVKWTPSSMDDPSAHVLEYISYWLLMSVVFTLKDITSLIIFVSGGSKGHKNGALNVVDLAIFS